VTPPPDKVIAALRYLIESRHDRTARYGLYAYYGYGPKRGRAARMHAELVERGYVTDDKVTREGRQAAR
jgi:hypothetical protein